MPRGKNRGKANWWKSAPPAILQTTFEALVEKLGLKEDELLESARLREWAKRNAESKYVPEKLLKAWNIRAHV